MLKNLVWLVLAFVAVANLKSATGEDWPHWRGPHQNGVIADGNYPAEWSETENIIWKKSVPGWGTSTPVISDGKILVTGEVDGSNALISLNLDGDTLWTVTLGTIAANKNRKASSANPSPVTDGVHAFAYFKSGDLACVDLDGKVVWQRNLQADYGPDRLLWDLGTSPVLTPEAVVVAVMHGGPSYLVALDKATGQEVWKSSRDVNAPGESQDSYTTPLVVPQESGEVIVVLGADHVTAHAADTGRELWRVGGLNPEGRGNYRSIASPSLIDNMIIAPYARGETLTAIRLGGRGDVSRSHVAWSVQNTSADVPSPVAHEGRVYLCGDRGDVYCLDVASGKQLWSERLPRNRYPYSASPVLAGDKLYLTREDGTTFVLRVGERPELLATNALRENTYASAAFYQGRLYQRTSEFLFCIGSK